MNVDMVSTLCPVCKATQCRFFRQAPDMRYGIGGPFVLVQCDDCSCVYLNPRPKDEALGRWYPPSYHRMWQRQVKEGRGSTLLDNRQRAEITIRQFPTPGCLLDVGCGIGLYVKEMRDRGWDAIGVEISGEGTRVGRTELGVTIYNGPLRVTRLPRASFDIITMWHVFEHLCDPMEELCEIRDLLKTSGHVLVAIPNIESVSARIFGQYWYPLDLPRHLIFPTRLAMDRIVRNAGLEIVGYSANMMEQNLNAWVMSIGRLAKYFWTPPKPSNAAETRASENDTTDQCDSRIKEWIACFLRGAVYPLEKVERLWGYPSTHEYLLRKI